jgi:uncharacterized membrane protein required for colicin V production
MIPIHTLFGSLLALFALIGSLRGWAKEVIVSFSVILALFVEHVLMNFVPPVAGLFRNMAPDSLFYTRAIIFVLITVFGYASPKIPQLGSKLTLRGLPDSLLGFFLGLLNGFLVVGTLIWFLSAAGWAIADIVPPAPDSTSANLVSILPPQLIMQSTAMLYIAVAAAFVFVIVVFI